MPKGHSKSLRHQVLPTPYEYALMSNGAYFNGYPSRDTNIPKSLSTDWAPIIVRHPNTKAYEGFIFVNSQTKHIVIAHRGTDPDLPFENIKSDADIFMNVIPGSYSIAKEFSSKVRGLYPAYTFSETGHSLGGIYAQLNGYNLPDKTLEVVTFDSPGCKKYRDKYRLRNPANVNCENNFFNYLSGPNIVNTSINQHVGNIIRIYIPHLDLKGTTKENVNTLLKSLYGIGGACLARYTGLMSPIPFLGIGLHALAANCFEYDLRQHAMSSFILAMDPATGQPYLQREVITWPNFKEYCDSKKGNSNWILSSDVLAQNIGIESSFDWIYPHYSVADFITPDFTHCPALLPEEEIAFKNSSLTTFDIYYFDAELIEKFTDLIDLDEESISEVRKVHEKSEAGRFKNLSYFQKSYVIGYIAYTQYYYMLEYLTQDLPQRGLSTTFNINVNAAKDTARLLQACGHFSTKQDTISAKKPEDDERQEEERELLSGVIYSTYKFL